MDLNKYKAFFFDFDGVLADSVEVKTKAFARLFQCYGSEIQKKVVEHHLDNGGMSRYDKFRFYFKKFLQQPLPDEEFQNLCDQFARLVVDEVVASPEIPGSQLYLEKCYVTSPCFVVSATPEDEIREIVRKRGLEKYFINVLGAPTSKQKNLERLLAANKLAPERCVFFGDAESDYRAAMSCGVNFIAILPNANAPLLRVAPRIKWYRSFNKLSAGNTNDGFCSY